MAPAPRSPRLIAILLRLLPASFRDRFGAEMEESLRQGQSRIDGEGRPARLRHQGRELAELLVAVAREHLVDLRTDLWHALRILGKQRVFAVTAVLSLGIGIGAASTVLALYDATFGRGIPGVVGQERLVNIKVRAAGEETFELTSYPNWRDLDASGVLEELAGFSGMRMSFSAGDGEGSYGEPELRGVQAVTGNYFSVLGVEPRRGRLLGEEEVAARRPVVVISSWLWRQRFAADPAIVGRRLRLDAEPYTVIGVAGEDFRGHFIGFEFDLFIPVSMTAAADLPPLDDRAAHWVEMVGRLHPGQTVAQAEAGLALQARALEQGWPELQRGLEIVVERCRGIDADLRGGLATFLLILGAVAGSVLAIACINVANLLLGRLLQRRHEIALRFALGAPRSRLARQLMTEGLLLAFLGGALGGGLALGASTLLSTAIPPSTGVHLDLPFDARSWLMTLTVSLLAALLFGLLPALRASEHGVSQPVRGSVESLTTGRLRGALVAGQVALSVLLLIAAGLFLRALDRASGLDPGFDPHGVVQARIDPSLAGIEEEAARGLLRDLLERAAALPGVERASLADRTPLSLGARFFPAPVEVHVPGVDPPPGADRWAIEHAVVSTGYLDTLGIPLLAGRDFTELGGDPTGPEEVIVNRTFVERFLEGRGAVGASLEVAGREARIVGVARDSHYRTLGEEPIPFLYRSHAQVEPPRATLLLRAATPRIDPTTDLRRLIGRLAPQLPVPELGPFERQLVLSFLPQRIAGAASSALGLIGLFLSAVGLYGVLAFSVGRRSAEIGVRLSLGASPADVRRLILRSGLRLALLGLLVGLALAALAARALSSFLYGVSPFDLPTWMAIALVMLATAIVAGWWPARRAARIDPVAVLYEP